MKEETRTFEGLSGNHHYTILNKRDIEELFKFGIVCTKIERDDSYYIITKECWDAQFEGESNE